MTEPNFENLYTEFVQFRQQSEQHFEHIQERLRGLDVKTDRLQETQQELLGIVKEIVAYQSKQFDNVTRVLDAHSESLRLLEKIIATGK